jgi:hypothetical protein
MSRIAASLMLDRTYKPSKLAISGRDFDALPAMDRNQQCNQK